jgi:seryl-tRNA synthetase
VSSGRPEEDRLKAELRTKMRQFILFLLDWLRQQLDPDYAADLAAYQEKRRAQQEFIETETQALRGDNDRLLQLQTERAGLAAQLEGLKHDVDDLEQRREAIRAERDAKLAALNNIAADDLRRRPL